MNLLIVANKRAFNQPTHIVAQESMLRKEDQQPDCAADGNVEKHFLPFQ